jgi:hypothetical protein
MKYAVLCAVVGATVLAGASAFAEDVKMKVLPRGPAEAAIQRRAPKGPVQARLGALVRYAGTTDWSLADAETVQEFFATRFGRPLPVSAWGQSAVHDRLGLDHRNALDVAVHPDSREGRALMAFLRKSGIPFVAIRSRLKGSSTGAHVHVGAASERIEPAARAAFVARMKAERSIVGDFARPAAVPESPATSTAHASEQVEEKPLAPPM